MAKGSKPKRQRLDFGEDSIAPEPVPEPTPPPKTYGVIQRVEIIRGATSEILSGYCQHDYVDGPSPFSDGTTSFCRKCLNPKPLPAKSSSHFLS